MGQQGHALAENAKNISEYYCERTYTDWETATCSFTPSLIGKILTPCLNVYEAQARGDPNVIRFLSSFQNFLCHPVLI